MTVNFWLSWKRHVNLTFSFQPLPPSRLFLKGSQSHLFQKYLGHCCSNAPPNLLF